MKLQVIKQRNLWWGISIAAILAGLVAMGVSWQQIGAPLRPSLDFVGGTRLELGLDCDKANCNQSINSNDIRDILAAQGLPNATVQVVDKQKDKPPSILIRTASLTGEQQEKVEKVLTEKVGALNPKFSTITRVGPTLGRQLFNSGVIALLASFALIMIYLAIRFDRDYAVFAILALVHDVLVTMGFFAFLGLVTGTEVDSLFIVSLLTIVGFSVNDTVVIYDRVRETIQLNPGRHINDIVDEAVNQTLSRSINTTFTTLLPLVAILFFGGETLKYFSLALIVGFISGAYSSIFIASSLLALWREKTGKAIVTGKPVAATAENV